MSRQLVIKWPIPATVNKKLEKEIVNLTKEEVVLKLFKKKKISSGTSASLLGLSLAEFMEVLKKNGIPFANYTEKDWREDKKAVREMAKLARKKKP